MANEKETEIKKIIQIPLLDDDKEPDPELIPGTVEDEDSDEDGVLDDEEVNPFGDKWEE